MKASWVLLIALGAVSGCYRYVATDPTALPSGSEVTIDLTSAGTANVRPAIGDFVNRVEGRVTQVDSSGITLALLAVRRRGDVASGTWSGESLRLARGDIDGMKTKQFSRGRTTVSAIALGGAAVGLVIAFAKAVGILETSGGGGKPVPPP